MLEEAGCQACKKLFLGERVARKCFLPESVQHQLRALRLLDLSCCRDLEGEVSTDGLCV